jgi:hypothetical protein
MTDLEMTKLCAEAMGIVQSMHVNEDGLWTYYPLHDDAQAMALVKKFHLECYWNGSVWGVLDGPSGCAHELRGDLNRAIVECVAKMQAAKEAA